MIDHLSPKYIKREREPKTDKCLETEIDNLVVKSLDYRQHRRLYNSLRTDKDLKVI